MRTLKLTPDSWEIILEAHEVCAGSSARVALTTDDTHDFYVNAKQAAAISEWFRELSTKLKE